MPTIEELYGPNVALDAGGFPVSTEQPFSFGGGRVGSGGAGRSWEPPPLPRAPGSPDFLTLPRPPQADPVGVWLDRTKTAVAEHPATKTFVDYGGPELVAKLGLGIATGNPIVPMLAGVGFRGLDYAMNRDGIADDPRGVEKWAARTALGAGFDLVPGAKFKDAGYSATREVAKRLGWRGLEGATVAWGAAQSERVADALIDRKPLRTAILSPAETAKVALFGAGLAGTLGLIEAPSAIRDARFNKAARNPQLWNTERIKYANEIHALSQANDGSTFNPTRGGDMAGHRRYAVSLFPNRSLEVAGPKEALTPDIVAKYIADNHDLLTRGRGRLAVGTWYDKDAGKWYVDITATPRSRAHAIYLGKKYNQKAIFDLSKFEEIPTGGDGTPVKIPEEEAVADAVMGGPLGGLFVHSMRARDEIYSTVARLKRIAAARAEARANTGTLNVAVAGLDPTGIYDIALMLRQHGQQSKLVNALRAVGAGHLAFFPDRPAWEARMREDFGDALDVLKAPSKPSKKQVAAGAPVYESMMDKLWAEANADFGKFWMRSARSAPEMKEFERFLVSNAGEAGRVWFTKTGPMFEQMGVPKQDIPWLLGFMAGTSTRADLRMNTNLGLQGYLAWKAGKKPTEVAKIAGGGFEARESNIRNLLQYGPEGPFGGLKTRHFQRNGLGDPNATTIDVYEWAHVLGMPGDAPGSDLEYRIAEAIMRDLAYQTGINPRDRFAMNWVGYHRLGNMPFRGYAELTMQRLQIPDEVTDRVTKLFAAEAGVAQEAIHARIRENLSPQELYESGLWMRGFEGGRMKDAGRKLAQAAVEKGAIQTGTELDPTELSTILAHPDLFPVRSYDYLRDTKLKVKIPDPSGAIDPETGKVAKIEIPNPNYGKLPEGFIEAETARWDPEQPRGTEGITPPWADPSWRLASKKDEIARILREGSPEAHVAARPDAELPPYTPGALPPRKPPKPKPTDKIGPAKEQKPRARRIAQAGSFKPGMFPELAVLAGKSILQGARRFKEWARATLMEFGPAIGPHLRGAWTRAWGLVGGALKSYDSNGWGPASRIRPIDPSAPHAPVTPPDPGATGATPAAAGGPSPSPAPPGVPPGVQPGATAAAEPRPRRTPGQVSPLPPDRPEYPAQGRAPEERFSRESTDRMWGHLPQESRDALHQIVENNRDLIEDQTRGVQSVERARAIGADIVSNFRHGPLRKGTTLNDAQLAHLGGLVSALQTKIDSLTKLCSTPEGNSPANQLRLKLAHQELLNAVVSIRGVRSEMGRGLAFMRHQMKALASQDERMVDRALKAGIDVERVKSAMTENAGNPEAQFRALMAARRIGARGLWRWYIATNLLANPQTHEVNVLTNIFNTARLPISTLAAAPLDAAVSATTGRPRQLYAGEVGPQLAGFATSVVPAIRKSLHVLLKGYVPGAVEAGDIEMRPPEPGFGTLPDPVVMMLNLPGRLSAVADVFGRTISTEMAVRAHAYYLARRRVLESGSRGTTARGKIAEEYGRLLAEPTDDMLRAAELAGERTVFQEPAGPMIRAAKELRDSFGPLGDLTAMFVKTPLTIAKQGIQATPFGLVYKDARTGGRLGRQLQGEAIAGSLFTGAILAAHMTGTIRVNGAGPSDRADRDTWLAAGNLPQSIVLRIPEAAQAALGLEPSTSNQYAIPFKALGPLAVPMSAIGNLFDAIEDTRLRRLRNPEAKVDYLARGFETAARVGSTLVSLGAFKNMYDFLNAVEDPAVMGKRWIMGVTNALTPYGAGLRGIARTMDPVVRQPQAVGESFGEQARSLITQTVQSGLPGQSYKVLPRIGNSGRVVTNKTNPLFEPDIVPINENPTRRAMAEVGLRLPMQDVKSFTVSGKTLPLSPQDQNLLAQARGRTLYAVSKRVVNTSGWQRGDAKQKRELIETFARPQLDLIRLRALKYVRRGEPIPSLDALLPPGGVQ